MPTAGPSGGLSELKALLPRMTSFLKKHWFFAGIVLVIVYASGLHGQNLWVQEYHVLTISIFLALEFSRSHAGNQQLKIALPGSGGLPPVPFRRSLPRGG